jgi:hypothetical protein
VLDFLFINICVASGSLKDDGQKKCSESRN